MQAIDEQNRNKRGSLYQTGHMMEDVLHPQESLPTISLVFYAFAIPTETIAIFSNTLAFLVFYKKPVFRKILSNRLVMNLMAINEISCLLLFPAILFDIQLQQFSSGTALPNQADNSTATSSTMMNLPDALNTLQTLRPDKLYQGQEQQEPEDLHGLNIELPYLGFNYSHDWYYEMHSADIAKSGRGLGVELGICIVSCTLYNVVAHTSLFAMVAVGIDQYFAIIEPLEYPTKVTKAMSWQLIVMVWALGLVASVAGTFQLVTAGSQSPWHACRSASAMTGIQLTYDSEEAPNSAVTDKDRFILLGALSTYQRGLLASFSLILYLFPVLVLIYLYLRIFFAATRNSREIRRSSLPRKHAAASGGNCRLGLLIANAGSSLSRSALASGTVAVAAPTLTSSQSSLFQPQTEVKVKDCRPKGNKERPALRKLANPFPKFRNSPLDSKQKRAMNEGSLSSDPKREAVISYCKHNGGPVLEAAPMANREPVALQHQQEPLPEVKVCQTRGKRSRSSSEVTKPAQGSSKGQDDLRYSLLRNNQKHLVNKGSLSSDPTQEAVISYLKHNGDPVVVTAFMANKEPLAHQHQHEPLPKVKVCQTRGKRSRSCSEVTQPAQGSPESQDNFGKSIPDNNQKHLIKDVSLSFDPKGKAVTSNLQHNGDFVVVAAFMASREPLALQHKQEPLPEVKVCQTRGKRSRSSSEVTKPAQGSSKGQGHFGNSLPDNNHKHLMNEGSLSSDPTQEAVISYSKHNGDPVIVTAPMASREPSALQSDGSVISHGSGGVGHVYNEAYGDNDEVFEVLPNLPVVVLSQSKQARPQDSLADLPHQDQVSSVRADTPKRKCSFSSFSECRYVANGGHTQTVLFSIEADPTDVQTLEEAYYRDLKDQPHATDRGLPRNNRAATVKVRQGRRILGKGQHPGSPSFKGSAFSTLLMRKGFFRAICKSPLAVHENDGDSRYVTVGDRFFTIRNGGEDSDDGEENRDRDEENNHQQPSAVSYRLSSPTLTKKTNPTLVAAEIWDKPADGDCLKEQLQSSASTMASLPLARSTSVSGSLLSMTSQMARRVSCNLSRRASSMYHFFSEKEEMRTAKITSLVIGFAFICWLPFIALLIRLTSVAIPSGAAASSKGSSLRLEAASLKEANPHEWPKEPAVFQGQKADLAVAWLHLVACSMTIAFAAISPYVYVFRSSKVRKSVASILRTMFCCNRWLLQSSKGSSGSPVGQKRWPKDQGQDNAQHQQQVRLLQPHRRLPEPGTNRKQPAGGGGVQLRSVKSWAYLENSADVTMASPPLRGASPSPGGNGVSMHPSPEDKWSIQQQLLGLSPLVRRSRSFPPLDKERLQRRTCWQFRPVVVVVNGHSKELKVATNHAEEEVSNGDISGKDDPEEIKAKGHLHRRTITAKLKGRMPALELVGVTKKGLPPPYSTSLSSPL